LFMYAALRFSKTAPALTAATSETDSWIIERIS
jgi:hypothetical protein